MSKLPFKASGSSSPESDAYWSDVFKTDRSTQPDFEDYEESDDDVDDLDIDPLERDED